MAHASQRRGKVSSPAELDALVGVHVTGEEPESFWADSHGHFQFATEEEAREAVSDPYYQQFLPEVDWDQTVIRQMLIYRAYCSSKASVWEVIEKATEKHGVLEIFRKQGRWSAAFGKHAKGEARTSCVAVCLAALAAEGVKVEVDHDRLDAAISHLNHSAEHGTEEDAAQ